MGPSATSDSEVIDEAQSLEAWTLGELEYSGSHRLSRVMMSVRKMDPSATFPQLVVEQS